MIEKFLVLFSFGSNLDSNLKDRMSLEPSFEGVIRVGSGIEMFGEEKIF